MPFFDAFGCDDLFPGMNGRGIECPDVLRQYEVAAAEDGDPRGAVDRPQLAQGADAKGGVEHAVREAAGADHLSGCGFEVWIVVGAGLELNVEQEVMLFHEIQELPQRRYLDKAKFPVNAAKVERLELRERVGADGPFPVTRPFDGLIVADDDLAVARELHVELDAVRAHLYRLLKGGHGIFRGVLLVPPTGAAMRPDFDFRQ